MKIKAIAAQSPEEGEKTLGPLRSELRTHNSELQGKSTTSIFNLELLDLLTLNFYTPASEFSTPSPSPCVKLFSGAHPGALCAATVCAKAQYFLVY